jgi:hypothetical protein
VKTCTKCGTAWPESEFRRQTKASDGLQSWCKYCVRDARTSKGREANTGIHFRRWAKVMTLLFACAEAQLDGKIPMRRKANG